MVRNRRLTTLKINYLCYHLQNANIKILLLRIKRIQILCIYFQNLTLKQTLNMGIVNVSNCIAVNLKPVETSFIPDWTPTNNAILRSVGEVE